MNSQNHIVARNQSQNNRRLWLLLAAFVLALPLGAQKPEAPRPPRKTTADTVIQRFPAAPEVEVYTGSDYEYEIRGPELEDMEELLEERLLGLELLQDESAMRAEEALRRAQESVSRTYRVVTRDAEEVIQAYKDAYGLILDQKWKEARKAYEEFLEKYSKSRYVDDARFWICYAGEQAGLPPEEVFEAYHQFIQEFTNSNWLDDARANLIRIGRELAAKSRKAKAQYGPIIESLEEDYDIEVAIATIDRLRNVSSDNALSAIFRLYDRAENDDLRKRIINALGRFNDPEAVAKLGDIARKDPDPDIRQAAVVAIGRNRSDAAFSILTTIIRGEENAEVRQRAIQSMRRSEGKVVVSFLLDVARNDPHIKVRTAAVSTLSRIDTPEAQEALISILEGK